MYKLCSSRYRYSTDAEVFLLVRSLPTASSHPGSPLSPRVGTALQLICPDLFDQLACVDFHRALDLAHAVCCTGGISLVVIALLKVLQPATQSGSQRQHLALAPRHRLHRHPALEKA